MVCGIGPFVFGGELAGFPHVMNDERDNGGCAII